MTEQPLPERLAHDLPIKADLVSKRPPARPGPWLLVAVLLVLLAGGAIWYFTQDSQQIKQATTTGALERQQPPELPASSHQGPNIDLLVPASNEKTVGRQEQYERKAAFGLKQSLDAVVRSDENIVINDTVVPMVELERLLNRYRGQVSDQSLTGRDPISAWGAYLVRPGDNLWHIHLRLLREYLLSRGVTLPAAADQPEPSGYSSGVGKILKFAEHMVGVYNVSSKEMSHNLNLLEPGEKIVVFNLIEIFVQLKQIDPCDLRGVMYDGRVLIFPKRQEQE